MLTFKVCIQKSRFYIENDSTDVDYVYVEANNPSTAKLDAVRWYDTFINKRDKNIPVTASNCSVYVSTKKVPRDAYHIYQYIIWYKVGAIDGGVDQVAVLAYGRTEQEAKRIAGKYGKISVHRDRVLGIKSIEREY